jgi:hypothetical protein
MVGAGAGLALLVAVRLAATPVEDADKAYWRPIGPPCPTMTLTQAAQEDHPIGQGFDFDGLRFARVAGEASCSGVMLGSLAHPMHADVCQFTSPLGLIVTTPGGGFAYRVVSPRSATVTVPEGGPARCVLAANPRED